MPPLSMKNAPELTSEQVLSLLIEPLDRASVVLAAGPRIFDSPTGDPLRIPRVATMDEAAWHAENEQITEANMDPDEVVLLPNTLKSVKTLSKFSNELARHSVIPIASALQAQLVRKVAKAIDGEFINGTGTPDGNGNRPPIGVQNMAGVQTGTWNTTPSAADVVDLSWDALAKLYAAEITEDAKFTWFVRSQDFVAWSKAKDADGKPLLQPDVTRPGRKTLQGFPIFVTSKLAAGKALLVDMSMIAVGRDLNPSVKVLDQTFADSDQMAIRVTARMDIAALHPEGIVVLTDATP